MKKLLTGLGLVALLAGQSVAMAATPAQLDRAPAAIADTFEADAGETYLLGVLLAAVVAGTIAVMSDDDSRVDDLDYPVSP